MTDQREGQHRADVEHEHRRDGVRDRRVGGRDHRRHRSDRRGTADAGTDADQGAQITDHPEPPADQPGTQQAGAERAEHDGQRTDPDTGDLPDRQLAAEQHDRDLQQSPTGKSDTRHERGIRPAGKPDQHAEDDGRYGTAEDRGQMTDQQSDGCDHATEHRTREDVQGAALQGSGDGGHDLSMVRRS